MRPHSVGALIKARDIRGNHLLDAPREVPVRKMDAVRELHHVAKKIRPLAEALENMRQLRPTGIVLEPFAVELGQLARGVSFIDPLNSRCRHGLSPFSTGC